MPGTAILLWKLDWKKQQKKLKNQLANIVNFSGSTQKTEPDMMEEFSYSAGMLLVAVILVLTIIGQGLF